MVAQFRKAAAQQDRILVSRFEAAIREAVALLRVLPPETRNHYGRLLCEYAGGEPIRKQSWDGFVFNSTHESQTTTVEKPRLQ